MANTGMKLRHFLPWKTHNTEEKMANRKAYCIKCNQFKSILMDNKCSPCYKGWAPRDASGNKIPKKRRIDPEDELRPLTADEKKKDEEEMAKLEAMIEEQYQNLPSWWTQDEHAT